MDLSEQNRLLGKNFVPVIWDTIVYDSLQHNLLFNGIYLATFNLNVVTSYFQ